MNWLVFAIATWLLLGVQWGFAGALKLGATDIAPYFMIVLVVWVALWAPIGQALAGSLVVGVLWDLSGNVATTTGGVVAVVGPHALGCLLGAYLVLTLRGVMLRKNLLTIIMLAALAALLCQLVATVLLTVRGITDPAVVVGRPLRELGVRAASALYTGALAALLGPALNVVKPLFGFTTTSGPGFRAH